MHDDRSLVPPRGITNPATIAIALQNRFPQPAKTFLILSPEHMTGRTQAQGKHLRVPAEQCMTVWRGRFISLFPRHTGRKSDDYILAKAASWAAKRLRL